MSTLVPRSNPLKTRLGKIVAGGVGLAVVALVAANSFTPEQIDFSDAAKGFDKAKQSALAVGIPITKEDIWPVQKPRSENAEPILLAMADIRQPLGSEVDLKIQRAMAAHRFAEVEGSIGAYDKLIAMASEAAGKKGFWTNKAWNGFSRDFEFHRGVKAAAAALERKAFIALKDSQHEKASDLFSQSHRLAMFLAEQPGINPALASISIKTRTLQNIALMASAFSDDESALKVLFKALTDVEEHPDLKRIVQGEALNQRFMLMTASTHGFAATARMYWLDSLDGAMEWASLETVPNDGEVEEKPSTFREKLIDRKLKAMAAAEKNRKRVPLCLDEDPEADDTLGRGVYARYYETYGKLLGFFKPEEKELSAERIREFTMWVSELQSQSQPDRISYLPATPSVSFSDASAHILRSMSRAGATKVMVMKLLEPWRNSNEPLALPTDAITGKPFLSAINGNEVVVYSPGFDGVDHRSRTGNHDDVIVRVSLYADAIQKVRSYFAGQEGNSNSPAPLAN